MGYKAKPLGEKAARDGAYKRGTGCFCCVDRVWAVVWSVETRRPSLFLGSKRVECLRWVQNDKDVQACGQGCGMGPGSVAGTTL